MLFLLLHFLVVRDVSGVGHGIPWLVDEDARDRGSPLVKRTFRTSRKSRAAISTTSTTNVASARVPSAHPVLTGLRSDIDDFRKQDGLFNGRHREPICTMHQATTSIQRSAAACEAWSMTCWILHVLGWATSGVPLRLVAGIAVVLEKILKSQRRVLQ
jgi:hypothetical protein